MLKQPLHATLFHSSLDWCDLVTIHVLYVLVARSQLFVSYNILFILIVKCSYLSYTIEWYAVPILSTQLEMFITSFGLLTCL